MKNVSQGPIRGKKNNQKPTIIITWHFLYMVNIPPLHGKQQKDPKRLVLTTLLAPFLHAHASRTVKLMIVYDGNDDETKAHVTVTYQSLQGRRACDREMKRKATSRKPCHNLPLRCFFAITPISSSWLADESRSSIRDAQGSKVLWALYRGLQFYL